MLANSPDSSLRLPDMELFAADQASSPFDLLPAESLVLLLSFIHIHPRLCRISRVCRRWRALVLDFISEEDRNEMKLHLQHSKEYIALSRCVQGREERQGGAAIKMCCAVAHSVHGDIPGKAFPGMGCYYPYGGREYHVYDFSWVVGPSRCVSRAECLAESNDGIHPDQPKLGRQRDGAGHEWVAIANTKWGRIPGKASADTCWYPRDGKEHTTSDFDYIISTCPW